MPWLSCLSMQPHALHDSRPARQTVHAPCKAGSSMRACADTPCWWAASRYSKENVDLAAALLTLACLGEGKEISWQHEPRLRFLLGLHSVREASRRVLI